ncbi:MAG: amidohydrolase [Dethiobacter sp.]|nr:amidohydrolase [Dethiobacter sp.]
MNIDSHVHLVDEGWIHDSFLFGIARVAATGAGKVSGEPADPLALLAPMKTRLFDSTGNKLIATMDAAGVDRSCIFALDYGLATGEPGVPMAEQNKAVAAAVKRFPDRLTGFFTIDPRRKEATELFARAVEDWGLKGLKLHPAAGFFPYDQIVYPLYEKCVEYKVPVLIHTGGQPGPLKSRFARPVYVDDVAGDFPSLPIIMAHCGHDWWEEALMVCNVKPNCNVDISGLQRKYLSDPTSFYGMLRKIVDHIGPWRVFFGTDGPYLNGVCPVDKWIKALRGPDTHDFSFTQEEVDIIMGRAFARLLS